MSEAADTMSELARKSDHESRDHRNLVSYHCTKNPEHNGYHCPASEDR